MRLIWTIYKSILTVFVVLIMFTSSITAQDSLKLSTNTLTFKSQFSQTKDAFNYGLVFNGLNLNMRYTLEKTFQNSTFTYSPEFSFGPGYNNGIGLSWGFVPIDIFYGVNIKEYKNGPIIVGAYFETNYNWQLYPELQSGHLFWYTSIEIGPQFIFSIPIKNRAIKITISNSLAGFTSRPKPATESYYYSLTFSDFVRNPHSNLEFGSNNLFNHTDLEIELLKKENKRFSIAYAFEYFGYYDAPTLNYLSHSLNFNWKIGKL